MVKISSWLGWNVNVHNNHIPTSVSDCRGLFRHHICDKCQTEFNFFFTSPVFQHSAPQWLFYPCFVFLHCLQQTWMTFMMLSGGKFSILMASVSSQIYCSLFWLVWLILLYTLLFCACDFEDILNLFSNCFLWFF